MHRQGMMALTAAMPLKAPPVPHLRFGAYQLSVRPCWGCQLARDETGSLTYGILARRR